ncbi:hypothetical protein HELRODRAFT_77890, partial [Helobdella robusta]|uniref:Carboxypeptidase n=1 Tax=Helobdella robusta TaxID=6412 RepID=T1G352_HELRO
DPGSPLFLTPYIENGDIDKALALSKVRLEGTKIVSYSGFLTVNKSSDSNMFFWFFPSLNDDPRDPVLLWLQGGPGGSSLFGLFVENGPFGVNEQLKLFEREYTWNRKYNLLFIDNPVGTGFSFANDDGYARNEDEIATNLYEALLQFFDLFPDLKGNQVYLTGESYAGKYIPTLANKIHTSPKPKKIYLRGVAIGDGFTDPPVMIHSYADYLYEIGLLDSNQRDFFRNQTDLCGKFMENKKWVEAEKIFDLLLNADIINGSSFYQNCTGMSNYYNYLRTVEPVEYGYYSKFITTAQVRKSIHVGNLPYQSGNKVETFLLEDFMQSAKHNLIPIMNRYKVLLYSGQLDVIVATPCTFDMINSMDWNGAEEFKRARRLVWKVSPDDVDVAGYVKRVHDFYFVTIKGAGHIAPYDQPRRSWDMLDRFISGRPFK